MDEEGKLDKATTLAASAHDAEARDEFARGVLDVVRQLCAILIGRGLVEAQDVQAAMKLIVDFWHEKKFAERAEPAEILFEAVAGMQKAKREVSANIFMTAPGRAQ
jgi:hypothetical protein